MQSHDKRVTPSEGLITVEVVTASNLNPKYLECVPYFIEFWKLMNQNSPVVFTPTVAIIAEDIPLSLQNYKEHIVLIPQHGFNDALVSQVIRLYLAAISKHDFSMTSDVDMLPLNPRVYEYGVMSLKHANDFVILRDVLPYGEFAICYNIASGQTWRNLFIEENTEPSILAFLNTVNDLYNKDRSYSGVHGGVGWNTDQRYLFDTLTKREKQVNLLRFTDEDTAHRRLDRAHHRFPINWLALPLVHLGLFSDYHVHHPVRRYKIFLGCLTRILRLRGAKK